MFCNKCGTKNNDGSAFCKECGAALKVDQNKVGIAKHKTKAKLIPKSKLVQILIVIVTVILVVVGIFVYMNTGARLAARQTDDGNKLLTSNQCKDAITAFEKAIGTYKDTPQAYIGLADSYICLKDTQKAESSLQNGIEASPKSDTVYLKLADVYDNNSRPEEAIQTLKSGYSVTKSSIIQAQLTKAEAGINTTGNTSGNIANGGIVTQQGDWIYYSNKSDNSYLYKMRTDGTDKIKINSNYSYSINVIGDWAYYINQGKNYSNYVYKIRTDGTEDTQLNNVYTSTFNVVGDWIYYSGYDDGRSNIYKMHTNGTGKQSLASNGYYHGVNVVGDWIYYIDELEYRISKVRTDGTEQAYVTSDAFDRELGISVIDDWIYYAHNGLNKMRTDGTDSIKIINDRTSNLNVLGDWIYYQNIDDNYRLYKIRTDGTDRTKLNSEISYQINVINDWIYYSIYDNSSNLLIVKLRTDGTDRQLVQ